MPFTSKDLPLAFSTPVTSRVSSSDSSAGALSPAPRLRYPLVNCVTALLLVVKTALASRVSAGDALLALAAASASGLDLHAVVRAVPLPLLSTVRPHFHARVYSAALDYAPSPFDVVNPNLPLHHFITRVFELVNASNCVLVSACIYIDRLLAAAPHLFVHSANVHKIFAVAVMLAVKFHEDDPVTSHFFSTVFGIAVPELNALELFTLQTIGYHVFISTEQFRDAQVALMSTAINSPSRPLVLHTLRLCEVSDVAQRSSAVANLFPLSSAHACSPRRSPPHPRPALAQEHARPHGAVAPELRMHTERARAVVCALAKVQMEHDFACLLSEPHGAELQRRLAPNSILRYGKLDRLAHMERVHDGVLPPLEFRREAPCAPWAALQLGRGTRVLMTGEQSASGFGSLLANGARPAGVDAVDIWRYVPAGKHALETQTGGRNAAARAGCAPAVVAGGLGVGPSIWSTQTWADGSMPWGGAAMRP